MLAHFEKHQDPAASQAGTSRPLHSVSAKLGDESQKVMTRTSRALRSSHQARAGRRARERCLARSGRRVAGELAPARGRATDGDESDPTERERCRDDVDSHDAVRASRHGLETRSRAAALSRSPTQAFEARARVLCGDLSRPQGGSCSPTRGRWSTRACGARSITPPTSASCSMQRNTNEGSRQRTAAALEQEGFAPHVRSHRYNPTRARQMLAEAGYPHHLELQGLVSETSTAMYAGVRALLAHRLTPETRL